MSSMKKYLKSWIQWVTNQNQQTDPQNQQIYIRFTYRSNIQKAYLTTYYDSDTGWGCMIRVGQMFIANVLYKVSNQQLPQIVSNFYDSQMGPYSIQRFTMASKVIYPQKKQRDWYTPCQVGFILQQLVDKHQKQYTISICNDNTLFLNQIKVPENKNKVIVILMCRIGLKVPQPQHLKVVCRLMHNEYFFALLGGIPKRAHLFLKYKPGKQNKQGKFGYLDPHQTIKTPKTLQQYLNNKQDFIGKLQWMYESKIDSSMGIAFVMDKQKVIDFYQSIQKIKAQIGKDFFLYIQKERPVYDSDIQIIEEEDQKQ